MEGFKLIAKSNDTAEIRLFGDVSQHRSINAREFQVEIDKIKGKYKNLKIQIYSRGGSIFEGFLIFNIIQSLPMNVEIQIMGIAASMGSVIAMAGKRISMFDNARIMIHQGSGGVEGSASQIKNYANLLEKINKTLAEVYARKSGKPAEWVLKNWMPEGQDTWFTAKEAMEAGLIDEILDHKTEAENAEFGEAMEFVAQLISGNQDAMTYRDWLDQNPKGLSEMQNTNPERFVALYKEEYGEASAIKIRSALNKVKNSSSSRDLSYDLEKEKSLVHNSHWTLADWGSKDPGALQRMQKENPEKFVALCKEEYGEETASRIREEIKNGNTDI